MTSHGEHNEPEHRSRLEDEVLEILSRADRPPTMAERARGWFWRGRRALRSRSHLGRRLMPAQFGPGMWILASAVAAIVALLIDETSPLLARILAILCVVFFAIPIVKRWRHPDEPDIKRWRGRDIDMRDRPPDVLDEFRRRFRRPPKR